jgi:tetratricopeptide (TPR) repeat protein
MTQLVKIAVGILLLAGELPGPVLPEGREDLDPAVLRVVERSIERVNAEPESAAARGRLAMAYEANLLWPEAARAYEQAAAIDTANELWRLHHGIALIQIGQVEAARRVLEELVTDAPELAPALERLGYLRLELGDPEGAMRAFSRLQRLMPAAAAAYEGAGEAALQGGDPQLALELLEQSLAIDPSRASARYRQGLALRALGRMEEARLSLAAGAGSEPVLLSDSLAGELTELAVHLNARLTKAAALLAEGLPAEAAVVLEAALEGHPENVVVLNDLAIARMRSGLSLQAHELLERAREIDPGHFGTYLNLSSWAASVGKPREAAEYARQAVQAAPGVAATHAALASTLGDPQLEEGADPVALRRERLDELVRAIELGIDSPDVYLGLARERARDGEVDAALEPLDAALRRWPDFWPADLMRAWILIRTDRWREAEAAVERVRRFVPEHSDLPKLERRLEVAALLEG